MKIALKKISQYTVECKKNCRLAYYLSLKLFRTFFEPLFSSYVQALDATLIHSIRLELLEDCYIFAQKWLIIQALRESHLTNKSYYMIEVIITGKKFETTI